MDGLPDGDGSVCPRVFLLLSGVAPLGGVLHQLGAGVTLPNWCKRCSGSRAEPGAYVEAVSQRPRRTLGVCGDESPAVVLVERGGRHYTPSDRVHRDVTGVALRNGCIVT